MQPVAEILRSWALGALGLKRERVEVRFLTLRETASNLGVPFRQVLMAAKSGKIKTFKVGRATLTDRASVLLWLKSLEVAS